MKISTINPGTVTILSLQQQDNTPLKLVHPVVDYDLDNYYDSEDLNKALREINDHVSAGRLSLKNQQGVFVDSVELNLPGNIALPKQQHVFTVSCRWYSKGNTRFYGPSSTYGPNYYQWNKNYGKTILSPKYSAMGFVCPWDGRVVSAQLQYRRSSTSPALTAYLVRHRKVFGTSKRDNVQIGSDLRLFEGNTGQMDKSEFDLSSNMDVLAGDHILPLLTSNVNTTYYLYSSLEIIIEKN